MLPSHPSPHSPPKSTPRLTHHQLGRLNLLTPSRILAATSTAKSGHTISLSLPLNLPSPPLFGRKPLSHSIRPLGPGAFDDEIAFNTQSSSQWDGFRHFADPRTGYFYNGVLSEEILDEEGDADADSSADSPPSSSEASAQNGAATAKRARGKETRKLGIDAWAKRGIVARGVLLDVWSWAQRTPGKRYDTFAAHPISAADLRACAQAQGTQLGTGDILLVRTGWLATYLSLSAADKTHRAALPLMQHHYAGLSSSPGTKDFLHDGYFAAAATDNAHFEVWPPQSFEESLHACMLPLWGMPIGELWDLEGLARQCECEGRWEFLLVSAPGDVPGGVGSAPNAVAIF